MTTCLLCRHGFTIRSTLKTSKRYASSTRDYPFILPRLAIDLDSADNKLVKRVEDIERDTPKLRTQPRSARQISLHQKQAERSRSCWQSINPFIVLPSDLLAGALLGRQSKDEALRKVIQKGELDLDETEESMIHQMSFAFYNDAERALEEAGFGQWRQDRIAHDISHCSNFDELQRVVSIFSSTTIGCEYLSRHEEAIANGIVKCRRAQTEAHVSKGDVLQFLMVLHQTLKAKGFEFGGSLCGVGLYYAGASGRLRAVKMFLKLALRRKYQSNFYIQRAVIHLCRLAKYGSKDFDFVEGKDLKREALKLITGWKRSASGQENERDAVSFAQLAFHECQTPEADYVGALYPAYLIGLGHLGLSDELSTEWRSDRRKITDAKDHSQRIASESAKVFAMAFLIAGDSNHALAVLQSVKASKMEKLDIPRQVDGKKLHTEGEIFQSRMTRWLQLHYRGFYGALQGSSYDRSKLFYNSPKNAQNILDLFSRILIKEPNSELKAWCRYLNDVGLNPFLAPRLKWDDTGDTPKMVVKMAGPGSNGGKATEI